MLYQIMMLLKMGLTADQLDGGVEEHHREADRSEKDSLHSSKPRARHIGVFECH